MQQTKIFGRYFEKYRPFDFFNEQYLSFFAFLLVIELKKLLPVAGRSGGGLSVGVRVSVRVESNQSVGRGEI